MRSNGYGFRLASIVLAVLAVVMLAGIWYTKQTDFLFVPLLLATSGSLCLRRYRKSNE
jgi:hypothetical protein